MLKGAFIFAADLLRQFKFPYEIDFLNVVRARSSPCASIASFGSYLPLSLSGAELVWSWNGVVGHRDSAEPAAHARQGLAFSSRAPDAGCSPLLPPCTQDRHVLIIEDLCDSGITLDWARKFVSEVGPAVWT